MSPAKKAAFRIGVIVWVEHVECKAVFWAKRADAGKEYPSYVFLTGGRLDGKTTCFSSSLSEELKSEVDFPLSRYYHVFMAIVIKMSLKK